MRIYTNPDNKYNELYEVIDQDTQWGVEYIMELESKISDMLEMYKFGLSHVTNDFTEELDTYKDELELLKQL